MMKIKLSLLSLQITNLLAGTAVSPLLPYMAQTMGEGGENFSKIFLTLPSLIVVPFLLIAGTLSLFINKKNLVLIGLCLYIISGVGCLLSYNEAFLLIFRALSGIAAGLVIPYSSLLIADYFKGAARGKTLSQSGIVNNASGMAVLIIAGVLTSIFWRLGFLVSLVAIIPLILIQKNVVSVVSKSNRRKYALILYFNFKPIVLKLALIYFIVALLTFIYFANISFLVVDKDLGGSFEAALAQSFYLLAGVISNISMLTIRRYSTKLLFMIKVFLISVGFLTLASFNITIYHIYIGSFLFGLGYGGFAVMLIVIATENTSRINRINAISLMSAAMYLGQFLSPLIFAEINSLFNITNNATSFLTIGIVFMFVTLVILRSFIKERKMIRLPYKNLRN